MVNSSFPSSVSNSSLFVYSINAKSLASNSWTLETGRKQAFKLFKVLFRNNTALAIYLASHLFVSWLYRLCIWLGLFSKLFKTSHLLKTNCFQAGVINGVLCSHLFNFAVNKNASVFIQGPALLCTGWFTIQCVNVSSSLEQRRACLSKQIWGWGWRGKLRPVHWTAAWKQNETTTWGNVRGKMILKGFQPSVPCNFRVAPTQGAKASCRGTPVLPGPLEELYWQLKIFL